MIVNAPAQITLKHTISGNITPKSIVHNGKGLFFAQNMIYKHTITVYNEEYDLVKTISDSVVFSGQKVSGGPVEATFSNDGSIAWVSNYTMQGKQFTNPGCDHCIGKEYDKGLIYKINTDSLTIEKAIEAGCVPKFIAATPDDKYILVSNWTSGDLTIIDIAGDTVIKTIDIGKFPRGIAVDSKSKFAYIAVMGANKIAVVDLSTFSKTYIKRVGSAPRHLCISPDDRYLYCSVNDEGKVCKVDLKKRKVVKSVNTGRTPRSMAITPDGNYVFVVNYKSGTLSKLDASRMIELEEVKTKSSPIGITLNEEKGEIWVACYSGFIQIFHDPDVYIYHALAAELSKRAVFPFTSPIWHVKSNATKLVSQTNRIPQPDTQSSHEEEDSRGYIIVGSFQVKENAERYSDTLSKQNYLTTTLPSQVPGFTYTAIIPEGHPDATLANIKKEVISSAWVYYTGS